MILELDTSLLDKIKDTISINQLVFLSLVLNENQKTNQSVSKLVSQFTDTEIQDLIQKDLIIAEKLPDVTNYKATKKLIQATKPDKALFDQFYETYPIYVTRPDGTKGFLRTNVNKCRSQYNKIVGKSTIMHEHLLKCLVQEMMSKTMQGKLGYMKTMWKWLTTCEWEAHEEEMQIETTKPIETYGTAVY